ncbi:Hypothetical protein A7982_02673 [Minicystis rosea]|nr:Hypothetical protein A7982_02673 [Minicystis rosea]
MYEGHGHPAYALPKRVTVRSFYMDKTLVSVEQYRACAAAGVCGTRNLRQYHSCNWALPDKAQAAINCVSWHMAETYCSWAGKRLPSEEEWEFAARGSELRRFPWGSDEGLRGQARCLEHHGQACPLGWTTATQTPEGLAHMIGLLWQWTSSPCCPTLTPTCTSRDHVLRGGNLWGNTYPVYSSRTEALERLSEKDDMQSSYTGIRCAKDAP